jgi:hypothetical protein
MKASEFADYLRKAVAKFPTQKDAAKEWDISPQYLNDLLAGKRGPGDELLKVLGFEKVMSYRRIR